MGTLIMIWLILMAGVMLVGMVALALSFWTDRRGEGGIYFIRPVPYDPDVPDYVPDDWSTNA